MRPAHLNCQAQGFHVSRNLLVYVPVIPHQGISWIFQIINRFSESVHNVSGSSIGSRNNRNLHKLASLRIELAKLRLRP